MAALDQTDYPLLLLSPADTVLVLRATIHAGETVLVSGRPVLVTETIGMGHKLARSAIRTGEPIVKYGARIGTATEDIPSGAHVHLHNVVSDYTPSYALPGPAGPGGRDAKAEGPA